MDSKDERDARRAAALRENLRRRKAQAREVKDGALADGTPAERVPADAAGITDEGGAGPAT